MARTGLERITRQNAELLERQRSLVEANNELTSGNTELRNMNEHLLIAAEEVETLNEEMQATSEELETLNEELQATVEELNTTNEELNARGNVLERSVGEARVRLTEVEDTKALLARAITDAPIAFAVVDDKGFVVQTSAVYDDLTALGNRLPKPGQTWLDGASDGHVKHEIRLDTGRLIVLEPS